MTRGRWGRFLACLAALATACAVRGDARPSMLLSASSDDHAWWIDRDEKGVVLWHATALGEVDRAAPVRRVAARFATAPEAIAAVGESLWLVFPPEPVAGTGGEIARREVLSLSTRRNPAVGHWYSVPPNGAEPRPSLEVPIAAAGGGAASGELLGFAIDGPVERAEPWILLGGGPAERLGVRLAAGAEAEFGLRLVRLDAMAWRPVDPPDGLSSAGARLVRTAAGRVAMVAPDGAADDSLVRFERVGGGGWSEPAPIGADAGSLVAWLVVDGRDVTVVRQGDDLDLAYERRPPARPLAWTSFPSPSRPWAIAGGSAGATLITVVSPEAATRTRIPALGTFAEAEVATFVPPGFGSGAWIHLPLLTALVLFILLGLLFVREIRGGAEAPSVAATRPFELPRRIAALAIDALPGAIVAMVALEARPLDLIRVPFSSLDVATAIPATLVAGSACLLGFLGEAFAGRSPGKWLLGGEVVRRDGGRAGILRHLGRNLLKFLALVAPPLVLPTLLSSDGLGVPERLTGTAVARRA